MKFGSRHVQPPVSDEFSNEIQLGFPGPKLLPALGSVAKTSLTFVGELAALVRRRTLSNLQVQPGQDKFFDRVCGDSISR